MSYTIGNLISDVLPRVSKLPQQSGISIFHAATSVQSLIHKTLLDRNADLQSSGDLDITIPSGGLSAALPTNFMAMAERPKASELYTDWMAGAVTSYDNITGALVVNVTTSSGTDTLADWDLALAATPGAASTVIGSSTTSLTVGTGTKSLTVEAGLGLVAGQGVYIITADLPATLEPIKHKLQPSYLGDDDDDHTSDWWAAYQQDWHGEEPGLYPSKFKVIGTTLWVRPVSVMSVKITGRYFINPTKFTAAADVIPWNSLFDEVFREGVVRILQLGISIPEASQDFMLFMRREIDTVVNSRIRLMPDNQRLRRSNFM